MDEQEAHSILSSVEDRRLYDWSLARNGNPDSYVWPFEVDITQTPTESPPPQVLYSSLLVPLILLSPLLA